MEVTVGCLKRSRQRVNQSIYLLSRSGCVVYGFRYELTVIEYEQWRITGLDDDMSDIGRVAEVTIGRPFWSGHSVFTFCHDLKMYRVLDRVYIRKSGWVSRRSGLGVYEGQVWAMNVRTLRIWCLFRSRQL